MVLRFWIISYNGLALYSNLTIAQSFREQKITSP
jgi:hypothetical protein